MGGAGGVGGGWGGGGCGANRLSSGHPARRESNPHGPRACTAEGGETQAAGRGQARVRKLAGAWCVARGAWCVARGAWRVACGVWVAGDGIGGG